MGPRARDTVALTLCLLGAGGGVLVATEARGDGVCGVRVVSSQGAAGGVPRAWAEAAREAEARLAEGAGRDCGAVDVLLRAAGGAVVRFVTRDGRVAERMVQRPEELGPVVEALAFVGGAPSIASASSSGAGRAGEPGGAGSASASASAPVGATSAASTSSAAPSVASAPPATAAPSTPEPPLAMGEGSPSPSGPEAPSVLAVARAGGHVASRGRNANVRYVASSIDGGARFVAGPWEVGAAVAWSPGALYLARNAPAGLSLSSLLFGVQVGRRVPVRRGVVRFGGAVGVAQLHAEAEAPVGDVGAPPRLDVVRTRVGAYAGLVARRDRRVRVTLDLDAAVLLDGLGKAAVAEPRLPALPGFSLGLSLGLEGQVL